MSPKMDRKNNKVLMFFTVSFFVQPNRILQMVFANTLIKKRVTVMLTLRIQV